MSVDKNINFISKAGFVVTHLSASSLYEGSMYSVEGRKEAHTSRKEEREGGREEGRKEGNMMLTGRGHP